MKKSKFSEEQAVGILREGQSGMAVKALCAKHNISEPTYYKWKKKYGGLEVNDVRAMRALNSALCFLLCPLLILSPWLGSVFPPMRPPLKLT
jgi:hypothetical protein